MEKNLDGSIKYLLSLKKHCCLIGSNMRSTTASTRIGVEGSGLEIITLVNHIDHSLLLTGWVVKLDVISLKYLPILFFHFKRYTQTTKYPKIFYDSLFEIPQNILGSFHLIVLNLGRTFDNLINIWELPHFLKIPQILTPLSNVTIVINLHMQFISFFSSSHFAILGVPRKSSRSSKIPVDWEYRKWWLGDCVWWSLFFSLSRALVFMCYGG